MWAKSNNRAEESGAERFSVQKKAVKFFRLRRNSSGASFFIIPLGPEL